MTMSGLEGGTPSTSDSLSDTTVSMLGILAQTLDSKDFVVLFWGCGDPTNYPRFSLDWDLDTDDFATLSFTVPDEVSIVPICVLVDY